MITLLTLKALSKKPILSYLNKFKSFITKRVPFLRSTRFKRLFYFFPVQLFFTHLKKNHLLIVFWLVVFGLITGNMGEKYGISYLFLSPEYLGEVSFASYTIFGFAFGGFVMAFNISSYIMNGHRFPFIATLSKPFFKYCVNNSLIPLISIIAYSYNVVQFHIVQTFDPAWLIAMYIVGFLAGYTLFIMVSIGYFYKTNKDIKLLFGIDTSYANPEKKKKTIKTVLHKKTRWHEFLTKDRMWTVSTYLSSTLNIRLARNIDHYNSDMLRQVLKQNHLNAAMFEIFVFTITIALSFLSEFDIFMIPAGASLCLIFTLIIMIISAMHSWFRGWSTTVFIILFALVNWFSQFNILNTTNKAYGMDYTGSKAVFSHETMKHYANKNIFYNDFKEGLNTLNNWRLKNMHLAEDKKEKPKLILINTSGGGIRSMSWTFNILSHVDSLLGGELMEHTALITGSSGGLIGASYYRELYLQEQQGKIDNRFDDKYLEKTTLDLLNPVAFNWAVNDLFKFRKFSIGNNHYAKDRGYAWEQKLNKNFDNALNKTIRDYYIPEKKAIIPTMVVTPTIEDDGRQLIISSQSVSYLSKAITQSNMTNTPVIDGIELRRFFREQNANNLQFTTALRMNATFPYIMPRVTLPSEPELTAMDAGLRDNFGLKTSLKYLYTFRNWISSNTSGVIIIQVRDKQKDVYIDKAGGETFFETVKAPIAKSFKNLFNVQYFNLDQMLQFTSAWYDGQVDVIDFNLENKGSDRVSLSWHLTPKEIRHIKSAINQDNNQKEIERLKFLME